MISPSLPQQENAAAGVRPDEAARVEVLRGEAALQIIRESAGKRTAFQTAGWIEAYFNGFADISDLVVIDIAAANSRLILPLEIGRLGPFRVADFPGGKHASFHAPIVERMGGISEAGLRRSLSEAARKLGLDAFLLRDCPFTIDGLRNPMLALPHAESPSPLAMLTVEGDGETLLQRLSDKDDRKKLRQMERRLAEIGEVTHGWAGRDEVEAVLDAVFAWKAVRFSQMGIDDPFAPPEAKAYLQHATAGNGPAMRFYVLRCAGTPVAVLGGAATEGQFSAVVIAHDPDPAIERTSPGIVLLSYFVKTLADAGFRHFDLGVGEARYKARFCPLTIKLFDAALGIGLRGAMAAPIFRLSRHLKLVLKRSRLAMRLLSFVRRLKA